MCIRDRQWCEPCLAFTPVFQQAAALHPDIIFGMLNSDTDGEIAKFFNIEQIPCVLAIKDQVVIDGVVGVMPVSYTHLDVYKRQVL